MNPFLLYLIARCALAAVGYGLVIVVVSKLTA